ncbi:MAG: DUF554 domain-containing protein [Sphingobacteriia bacterium]|jgi:uncharacterized protein|nr:DUF554 domain-containing protein [Sphingobacteriia bacterium]
MIGTLVNTATVIVGSIIGIFLKKGIKDNYQTAFFQVVGLITLCIGVSMVYSISHLIIVIVSLVLGTLLGTWMDIENQIERFGNSLKRKLKVGNDRFSEGLITATLLFCVGSMTIVGTIQEGMGISSDLLLVKAVLDGFSSIILASVFGVSILISAVPLLIIQGELTLLAMLLGEFFSAEMIAALTAVGGIILMGLGINILGIKKLAVANMLPALLLVILFVWIYQKSGITFGL